MYVQRYVQHFPAAGEVVLVHRGRRQHKRTRLSIISHLLSQVPCKPLAYRNVKLPRRQQPDGYLQPQLPLWHIPTPF